MTDVAPPHDAGHGRDLDFLGSDSSGQGDRAKTPRLLSAREEIRQFLVSRRGRLRPDQVGIEYRGGERRVPGLRREEVAVLAGVSTNYYTRLERGNLKGASESVLNAIAGALRLDEDERSYLFGLARAVSQEAHPTRSVEEGASLPAVRPSVQQVLDNLRLPAVVHNTRRDVVAANVMGRALYAPHFETCDTPNIARFIFLDPRARDYYVDWPSARRTIAAILRLEAGRDPLNGDITALVGELSTRSAHFRADWARHDVHFHRTGTKSFRHPVVGRVEVIFEVFEMPGEPGLSLVTYCAEDGSDSAERLELLSAWAATGHATPTPHAGRSVPTAATER